MNQYEKELQEKGVTVYRIKAGDTLDSVAKELGLPKIALQRANPSLPSVGALPVGQAILAFSNEQKEGQAGELGTVMTLPDGTKKYLQIVKKGTVQGPDQSGGQNSGAGSGGNSQLKVPNAELSKEQIEAIARQVVEPEYELKRREQRQAYEKALENVKYKEQESEYDYRTALEDLVAALASDENEAVQNAIERGLARSSIPQSVKEVLQKENQALRSRKEQEHAREMKKLAGERQQAGRDYAVKQDMTNLQQQTELQKQMERLEKANDSANTAADTFNASGKNSKDDTALKQQYEITKQLLKTVDRDQAKNYLKKNEGSFKQLWGNDRYDRLFAKYSD